VASPEHAGQADAQSQKRQTCNLHAQEIIIRHICVEGCDYIGRWPGANLRLFLQRTGADLAAQCGAFRGTDDDLGCIDMASALDPQTSPATSYAGEPIADPFGSPLRLRTAVKLASRATVEHCHGGTPQPLLGRPRLQLVQRDLRSRR
jgi:hypothetical protein